MTDHGPGFNYQFNPMQYSPNQGGSGGKHPVGKHQATITDTQVKKTNDETGVKFVVSYSTPMGSAVDNFNIVNNSADAVRIGHENLTALCLACGITSPVDFNNHGAILRGARCMIEIGMQKEPNPEGFTEVKRRYDVNGNEPGKQPANPPNNGFQAPGGFTPQQQPNNAMPQQFAQPNTNPNPNPNPAPQATGWPQANPNPAQQPAQQPQQQQPNPAQAWGAPQGQPQQQPNPQPNAWGQPQ